MSSSREILQDTHIQYKTEGFNNQIANVESSIDRIRLFETDDIVEDHRLNNILSDEEYKDILLEREELRKKV